MDKQDLETLNKYEENYKKLDAHWEAIKANPDIDPRSAIYDSAYWERERALRDLQCVKKRINSSIPKYLGTPVSIVTSKGMLIKKFQDDEVRQKFVKILSLCTSEEDLETLFSLRIDGEIW